LNTRVTKGVRVLDTRLGKDGRWEEGGYVFPASAGPNGAGATSRSRRLPGAGADVIPSEAQDGDENNTTSGNTNGQVVHLCNRWVLESRYI